MAKTRLIPPALAAELNDELSRLRAARNLNPKHGTRAGAVDCGADCHICVAEMRLDYLLEQVPRNIDE